MARKKTKGLLDTASKITKKNRILHPLNGKIKRDFSCRRGSSCHLTTKILFSFVAQFGNDEISYRIELQPKVTLASLLQLFVVSENKLENCEFTLLGSLSFQHVLIRIKSQKKLVRGRNLDCYNLGILNCWGGKIVLHLLHTCKRNNLQASTAEFFCTGYSSYCYVCIPPVVSRK